ncbi:hypothetical protein [Alicyclobacillus dauci]|uniref:ABC-2 family transporter protein n=1 Tax=Alicyclobacillus dauci TaxID=1475485 RepID=A0ABY6YZF1_9BACL|nr:hypothetical protein [Alicyclobacillus dauci]WAH35459.1 hypothetical protein NZD86_14270 [Alicyclobacillus dauci]
MRFSFYSALVFKEWRQQRWYLVAGMVLLSLSPLVGLLESRGESPQLTRMNAEQLNFPGLGYLVLVFSVGLALVSLSEMYTDNSLQIFSEPVPFGAVLKAKFCMGIAIVLASQTGTILWFGITLAIQHALGPFMSIFGFWLTSITVGLSFYAVTYVMVLIVRPLVFSILLTSAVVVSPLFVAEWFVSPWTRYFPDGSSERHLPEWGVQVYNVIRDISPYGVIHPDRSYMVHSPMNYVAHGLEPIVWPIVSFLLVLWVSRRKSRLVWGNSSIQPRVQIMVRLFSTLSAAAILQSYVLHIEATAWEFKLVVAVLLWACSYLLSHAFTSYIDDRRVRKKPKGLLSQRWAKR